MFLIFDLLMDLFDISEFINNNFYEQKTIILNSVAFITHVKESSRVMQLKVKLNYYNIIR